MILDVQGITKSYNSEIAIEDISFHIEEGQKCALIGNNGSGKTTLLRLIMSELSPDEGNIYIASQAAVGYLPQVHEISSDMTLYEYIKEAKKDVFMMEKQLREMEERMRSLTGSDLDELMQSYSSLSHTFELQNGFAAESEINGVIHGLGFSQRDLNQVVSTMSGGEKTRAALGRLLLTENDLLLLDEPTNHLDLKSVEWLEGFISSYKGAVLIVSHDRYFLDRIVTKVVEIENHHASSYEGNYTAYSQKKAEDRRAKLKAYMNQQAEIKHQEEVIAKLRSFNREKSIKRAESRVKALDKIKRLDKPIELKNDMHLTLSPAVLSGNDVLTVKDLSKSYGNVRLFDGLELNVYRSEKIALIGDNGTGKTTILKIINEIETPDSGSVRFGANVFHAYYDQEHQILDPSKNIFEEISDEYPYLSNTEIRNLLAGFMFTGDDIFKRTENLSGGEKARLSLAKLMLSQANFLILDEPTNHLDIVSREILEQAINDYEGTVLCVSHDRYFINRTATRILELENAKLTEYKGNYDYYAEKKAEKKAAAQDIPGSSAETVSANLTDWKDYKKEQARLRKLENDLKKTETEVAEHEAAIKEIDELILLPENVSDPVALSEFANKRAALEAELEELYEKWESLSEALE